MAHGCNMFHILSFLTSFCGWASFGLTISAIANFSWVIGFGTQQGLWNICPLNGGTCNPLSEESWLLAVRAFSIMSLIIIWAGGSALIHSQCKNSQPARRVSSVLFFIGGIFGIIAMSVYTSQSRALAESVFGYYGAGFIMGWVACLLAMWAGAFAFWSYRKVEECQNTA